MRTPIIAGNWKMNKTVSESVEFVRAIRSKLSAVKTVDSVICPPFTALAAVADALKGTSIGIGAQNVHYEKKGAFTGECSVDMLKPFCQYVIVGHSERRAYFGETDSSVNLKIKALLEHDMTPIICVGESLEQNEAGETHSFVSGQVKAAFASLTREQAEHCILAYEPIWAIGTGKSATAVEAGRVIGLTVRGTISDLFGEETAQKIRIQYGGSANSKNIGEYLQQPDIDGALVGGASLKPDFADMVRTTAELLA